MPTVVLPFLEGGASTLPACPKTYESANVDCLHTRPSIAKCRIDQFVATGPSTGQCSRGEGSATAVITIKQPANAGGYVPPAGVAARHGSETCASAASADPVATAATDLLGYDIYASPVPFSSTTSAVIIGFMPASEPSFFHSAANADRLYYGAVAVYEGGRSALVTAPPIPPGVGKRRAVR